MKLLRFTPYFALVLSLFISSTAIAQTTVTIGTGSSSSSTRGPFQRSDAASSTVFSRWVMVYTAAELAAAGIPSGASITELNWELASSNTIIGTGNANLKIYIRNSSATAATADSWTNLTAGSSLVYDEDFNTTNNFPGANGFMPFVFNAPFNYAGGAVEIAVDWDCSQVSTPAFSGDGSIKWRYASTSPNSYVVKKTSSSSPSSTITDLSTDRANIQIVFNAVACDPPASIVANNITTNSAELSWMASTNANSYNWKLVASGAGSTGTAIASGSTSSTMTTITGLSALTSYDFYIESDCGGIGSSGFYAPTSFLTLANSTTTATIGMGSSSSSSRGPIQRSDTNSTSVYTRWAHVYSASELAAAGINDGVILSALNWELASDNIIIGSGNANLKVYIRNSSATSAMADSWSNLTSGSSLVFDQDFNTTNNFPGANGWMPFNFNTPFTYTGGALEIAVDWDCSQVSTPAFSGDGSLKWRYDSTSPNDMVVKKTSSSSPSSTLSDLSSDRANIQIVFSQTASSSCLNPNIPQISGVSATASPSIYNVQFSIANPGDRMSLQIRETGASTWKTPKTWTNASIVSQNFVTPSFGGMNEVRIGSQSAGVWTYSCVTEYEAQCKPMSVSAIELVSPFCDGDSALLKGIYSGGYKAKTFLWSTGETTRFIYGQQGQSYTVYVTDEAGCVDSASVMVSTLTTTHSPTNFTVVKPDAVTFTGSWSPSTLGTGVTLLGYRMAYRQASVGASWTTTPLTANTTATVNFTGSGLPAANYDFASFARVNDNGTVYNTEYTCIERKFYNGSGGGTPAKNDEKPSLDLAVDGITVYPNPAQDFLNVQAPLGSKVEILNTIGQLVFSLVVEQEFSSIQISSLPAGAYMVRVQKDHQVITERVIKE